MTDLLLLQILGLMIVAAAAVVLLARVIRMPTIVAYIFAGLALGPVSGIIVMGGDWGEQARGVGHAIAVISEVGIALLLFLVGLELSLAKIRDVGRVAVLAGLGQVVFTAVGGFVVALLLGFDVMSSVFLATALTFSSTVVVVKLLDQKKELHALYGRIAVGIFLVQDLVVIVVLTTLAGLDTGGGAEAEGLRAGDIAWGLTQAFLGMGLMLVVALLASRWLLPRPLAWAARQPQTVFVWALCWCFLFVVAAEWMSLSAEIGAFLAGLSLAQLPAAEDLRRRVHPLMNFFIAVFFISLGAQMELGDAFGQLGQAAVLAVFVLVGNPFIFMWIIAKSGYGERTSFYTSVTVAQISEFSFIFVAMGVAAGLVGEAVLSVVTLVGLVTIGVSAYMILYNRQLYAVVKRMGLLRMFNASQAEDEEHAPPLRGHVVVLGMNAMGRAIAEALHERGETVLAIDTDPSKLAGLGCRTLVGNIEYPMVVEEAQLAHARLGVSALQIEDVNTLFAYRCKRLGVPVAVHVFDRSVLADLRKLGVDFLIDSRTAGRSQVSARLAEAGVLAR
ncbi:MAG: cation:proton antiporter [Phycisphaeraceae bacterium]